MKRGLGRGAGGLDGHRTPVGDMGFEVADVDLAMSRFSERVLSRVDFAEIKRRRLANFKHLTSALEGQAIPVMPTPGDGVCPLFFPILVPDKASAAAALQRRGVDALEFWNEGVPDDDLHTSAHARF